MKQIYELHADGQSLRAIAHTLGLSRNSVRKYRACRRDPETEAAAKARLEARPIH